MCDVSSLQPTGLGTLTHPGQSQRRAHLWEGLWVGGHEAAYPAPALPLEAESMAPSLPPPTPRHQAGCPHMGPQANPGSGGLSPGFTQAKPMPAARLLMSTYRKAGAWALGCAPSA